MNPIVHGELSWLTAQRLAARRDRLIVTLAGLSPDVDGLSILGGEEAYSRYHHVLTHGLFSALACAALCAAFAVNRKAVALLAFLAFHLHLLCDFVGSGPGWGLFYLWPLRSDEWLWSGQWNLASWQNSVIGLAVTLVVLACALPFRRTIVELFSERADAKVVAAVRARLTK